MKSVEPNTSATLFQRLRDPCDDPLGWPRFVKAYGPLLLNWCRGKGLQEDDARDVTQEVLFTFARQVGRFSYDPSRSFRGYLRRLMHAAWCDWVERQCAWHRGSGDPAVFHLIESLPARDDLAVNIERDADQQRLELAMARVRARVEPRTWEAFRLLAIEGLRGDEAATRLGMRRGSAFAARCKVQRLIRLELARHDDVDQLG